MQIAKDRFVELEFELWDDRGTKLDAAPADDPLGYLHGRGDMVPGLERHLEGKEAGDTFEVSVDPMNGFGERDESRIVEVERAELGPELQPEIGMVLAMETPDGDTVAVRVAEVKPQSLVLDANHAFAGLNLRFKGKVVGVREANADELRGCCGNCD